MMPTSHPANYSNCRMCVQPRDAAEAPARRRMKFENFQQLGNAYFDHLRMHVLEAVEGHFSLDADNLDLTVNQAIRLMRKYPDAAEISKEVLDQALLIVIRHRILPGDKIKNELAHALGAERLKEALSPEDYDAVHGHINAVARILIGNLCKVDGCAHHAKRTSRSLRRGQPARGTRRKKSTHRS